MSGFAAARSGSFDFLKSSATKDSNGGNKEGEASSGPPPPKMTTSGFAGFEGTLLAKTNGAGGKKWSCR